MDFHSEGDARRGTRSHRVSLTDHETVVTQMGDDGPAVVLIHSMGVDRRMWEPVMPRLSAGRRVFAYDVRCHGEAVGAPIPFTMADTARDLLGVLDVLAVDRAHLVGLSLGGAIAQTAAVAWPDRFVSLALLATTDHPFPDVFEARARSAETEGMPAQVDGTLTRWFTPEALAADGWAVRYARECVERFDPAVWAATWRAYKSLDVMGRLDGFPGRILLMGGGSDVSAPPEFMAALAERIPGAHRQEVARAPHMLPLERPVEVAEILDRFLPADRPGTPARCPDADPVPAR
ncbi:alpha/beta hydrolase [Actinoallomurus purpureus]|uniref:alpha/beta fold hydrolase n=1 Tax=Actinoallomurus purpureus TaxID=478114 RepID=UPI0020929438|nr:alpha/beta fold hydrolase [Actinoallomurus purpureus]MCO6010295.1 alpha/beta hydrolase [Actinoallomurus purpureus]